MHGVVDTASRAARLVAFLRSRGTATGRSSARGLTSWTRRSGLRRRLLQRARQLKSTLAEAQLQRKQALEIIERAETELDKGQRLVQSEIQAYTYCRHFDLPEDAETADIKASSQNGILQLQISRETPNPPKKIKVTQH